MLSKDVNIPENPTFKQLAEGIDGIHSATLTLNNYPTKTESSSFVLDYYKFNGDIKMISGKSKLFTLIKNILALNKVDTITKTSSLVGNFTRSSTYSQSSLSSPGFFLAKEGETEYVYYIEVDSSDYYGKIKLSSTQKVNLLTNAITSYTLSASLFLSALSAIPHHYSDKLFGYTSKRESDNSTTINTFLLDFQTGSPVITTVVNINITEYSYLSIGCCYYIDGNIIIVAKDGANPRTFLILKYNVELNTYTTVLSISSDDEKYGETYWGYFFYYNKVIYIMGMGCNKLTNNQKLSFIYDTVNNKVILPDEVGNLFWDYTNNYKNQYDLCLFNGDDSIYSLAGGYIDYSTNNIAEPFIQRIILPHKTIPSLKGSTYNLNVDSKVGDIQNPPNTDFLVNDYEDVELRMGVESVSGTIKVETNNI